MITAFTGHRPPKTGLTYSHQGLRDQEVVRATRHWLEGNGVSYGIVGGALGFDTLAARACWLQNIPYTLAIPFEGQDSRWPPQARERYAIMRAEAHEVVVVTEGGYSAAKMNLRNRWMVDNAEHLLAWWNGSPGGTGNCIRYAEEVGLPLTNLYDMEMDYETKSYPTEEE